MHTLLISMSPERRGTPGNWGSDSFLMEVVRQWKLVETSVFWWHVSHNSWQDNIGTIFWETYFRNFFLNGNGTCLEHVWTYCWNRFETGGCRPPKKHQARELERAADAWNRREELGEIQRSQDNPNNPKSQPWCVWLTYVDLWMTYGWLDLGGLWLILVDVYRLWSFPNPLTQRWHMVIHTA